MQPRLIIHGGAGNSFKEDPAVIRQSLYPILEEVYRLLLSGASASAAVVRGCQLLEDEPLFNAGTGSVVQADGQIRMSASLMDGLSQTFSGVINVSWVQNPIYLAQALQAGPDRVLSDYGALELLRELRLPVYNPLTERRLQEWLKIREERLARRTSGIPAERSTAGGDSDSAPQGTIGVVALDSRGRLAAGTSTGGKSFARSGRVSDSATPAGNYATEKAAVSCTGIGEDILDECLACRIVIRATDGLSLRQAFERSIAEAAGNRRELAAIGLDSNGAIAWGKTSKTLIAAYHTGHHTGDTLGLGEDTGTGGA